MIIIYSLLLIAFLWFFRTIKAFLFWIYLWQLKDYHWNRFVDHFRTEKGKKIFLNCLYISKITLLIYGCVLALLELKPDWLVFGLWGGLIFLIYFVEAYKFLKDSLARSLVRPVFTSKAIVTFIFSLSIQVLYIVFVFLESGFSSFESLSIYSFYFIIFFLLLFDIFLPSVSLILIFFIHFFSVIFFRNKIIEKARAKRLRMNNLLAVGITGSFGKTSTKEFLAGLLEGEISYLKTNKHQNSEVAVSSLVINNLKKEHVVFICEMGAYNKGGIKLLASIARPKIGVISGVNQQHLSLFGSMRNLISAEGGEELIESLPEDGLVVFNGNNDFCRDLYFKTNKPKKIIYAQFGDAPGFKDADLVAKDIKIQKDGISFTAVFKDGESANFKLGLLGRQNIPNILLAVLVAKNIGISQNLTLEKIVKKCEALKPFPSQMELKRMNNLNIIDSTYSANPDGVLEHLDYLKTWLGNRVVIMPCLIELGKESEKIHYRIGQKIGDVCNFAIVTTREMFQAIKEGAMSMGMKEESIIFMEDKNKIFDRIRGFEGKEDIILLEGRSPEGITNLILNANAKE